MNSKTLIKSFIGGAAAGAIIVYLQNTGTAVRTRLIHEVQKILWRFC